MKMADPIPQFSHLVKQLRDDHHDLAYLHVVEPRMLGFDVVEYSQEESNDFIRAIWQGRPLIVAGGYEQESASEHIKKHPNELVAFGRSFAANVNSWLPLEFLIFCLPFFSARPTISLPSKHFTEQRKQRDILCSGRSTGIHRLCVCAGMRNSALIIVNGKKNLHYRFGMKVPAGGFWPLAGFRAKFQLSVHNNLRIGPDSRNACDAKRQDPNRHRHDHEPVCR
jgi:hypothetical protein